MSIDFSPTRSILPAFFPLRVANKSNENSRSNDSRQQKQRKFCSFWLKLKADKAKRNSHALVGRNFCYVQKRSKWNFQRFFFLPLPSCVFVCECMFAFCFPFICFLRVPLDIDEFIFHPWYWDEQCERGEHTSKAYIRILWENDRVRSVLWCASFIVHSVV